MIADVKFVFPRELEILNAVRIEDETRDVVVRSARAAPSKLGGTLDAASRDFKAGMFEPGYREALTAKAKSPRCLGGGLC
jgi:hypothetical protein